MKNKNVIVGVLAGILIIGGIYYFGMGSGDSQKDTANEESVATTTTEGNTSTGGTTNTKPTGGTQASGNSMYTKVGDKKLLNGIYITPLHVTFDGRCPVDVQCIQAGTVDLGILAQSGTVTQNFILSLNKPATFGGRQITLTEVTPKKLSTKNLIDTDYRFVITVK